MKAYWQYVKNAFFYILAPVAIYSCLPCKRCHTAECVPPIQVVHNSDLPAKYSGFRSKPHVIQLKQKRLHEISGIAASFQNKNILYLHEDSGHPNCIYLTNNTGQDLGRLIISNSYNRDWEDIAVGPGPLRGHSYIYVADIGDNNAWRCKKRIYRFPEPDLTNAVFPVRKTIKHAETITLQYPDKPHNAEAILLDPLTRDLYIATKEDNKCSIYVASFPQSTRQKVVLEPVITLPLSLITGGNISHNGLEIILRNEDAYWYWKRAGGESIAAALTKAPQQITPVTKEPQGEAICFATTQPGYFTCSEVSRKQQPVIYFYEREH
jgi:hypothetical protein